MFLYILGVCLIIYYLLKRQHTYWARKGISQIEPKLFFGNIKELFFQKTTVSKIVEDVYYEFKERKQKHGGIYLLYTPVWIPIDRELIKQIMIKDHSHFDSHGFFYHEKDPMSVHLFNVQGAEWKDLRAKLSPTFSTAKIKMMSDIVNALAKRIEKKVGMLCEAGQSIEIKENAACFGIDAIASCFFGIDCDCLNEPDNEFRRNGKILFEPRPVKIWLEQMFNWDLLAYTGHTFSPKEIATFFRNLASKTIEYREKNNILRKDYLDLLIQLKNKGKLDDDQTETGYLTFNQVCANMVTMYAAGFETSSTTTAFLLYELAKNQVVQDKVRDEILRIFQNRHDNEITYEDLAEMKYCDMCILETVEFSIQIIINIFGQKKQRKDSTKVIFPKRCIILQTNDEHYFLNSNSISFHVRPITKYLLETLRRYTPLPEIPRRCTKTYQVPGTNTIIEKGTMVMIPAWVIHKDAEYYPDPLSFNPENFSTENKEARPEFTFLGFGEGPRICIGFRFALMQVKIALIYYLRKYKYTLNPRTPKEVSYKPNSITLTANEDILLDITKIN